MRTSSVRRFGSLVSLGAVLAVWGAVSCGGSNETGNPGCAGAGGVGNGGAGVGGDSETVPAQPGGRLVAAPPGRAASRAEGAPPQGGAGGGAAGAGGDATGGTGGGAGAVAGNGGRGARLGVAGRGGSAGGGWAGTGASAGAGGRSGATGGAGRGGTSGAAGSGGRGGAGGAGGSGGGAGTGSGGGPVSEPDTATRMKCTGTDPIACHFGGQPGNYDVTVVLGGTAAANTLTQAEASRGMLAAVATTAGQTQRFTFTVNVRQPEGEPIQDVRRDAGPRPLLPRRWRDRAGAAEQVMPRRPRPS